MLRKLRFGQKDGFFYIKKTCSTFLKYIFSQLMKQFILAKVFKVILGKDSTDINNVCFMDFASMRKYLKRTLKRSSIVMAISI